MYGDKNGTNCRDEIAPAETAGTPLCQLPNPGKGKNDPGKAGGTYLVPPEKKAYKRDEEHKKIVQEAGSCRRGA
jgi:hypothetical protein